jgi:FMN phosphatase YigB (HAD superfamily)
MIFLLDVDNTLAHFNSEAGEARVMEILKEKLGEKGVLAAEQFCAIFDAFNKLHHGSKEPKYFALKEKTLAYKISAPVEGLDYMWSRELWLKLISDENSLELQDEQITGIIDEFWQAVSKSSPIYPDVEEFLSSIKQKFIAVSSDGRLQLKNGNLVYDPEYSRLKKINRLFAQGFSHYFEPDQIITGDPYEKPSDQFWETTLGKTGAEAKDVTFVDDSLRICSSAAKFGFKAIVIDRKARYSKDEAALQGVSYVNELGQISLQDL